MIRQITCGTANCFIISEKDSAVLVDTGTAAYRKKILRACAGKNVKLIVLTHGHYDHAQNAAFLSRALGAPVAMHPADLPVLRDVLAEPIAAHTRRGKVLAGVIRLGRGPALRKFTARAFGNPDFVPEIELCDGFSLEPYGVAARVAALPGHTRGSVGVVAGKDVLAGDALMHIGKPGPALHYVDRAAMETSAAKLTALGKDVMIWFGHGRAIPLARM